MYFRFRNRILHNLFLYLCLLILYLSSSKLKSDDLIKDYYNSVFLCLANRECLLLEIADTPAKREFGLMGRKYMKKNRGMLFLYEEPSFVKMWMLNTHIKLDIIFIRNNKIVSIMTDIKPCIDNPCKTYGPEKLVDSVIEVNSGIAKEQNLFVGQEINLFFNQ